MNSAVSQTEKIPINQSDATGLGREPQHSAAHEISLRRVSFIINKHNLFFGGLTQI